MLAVCDGHTEVSRFGPIEGNRTMRMILGIERSIFQVQPHLTAFFPFLHEDSAEDHHLIAIQLGGTRQRCEGHTSFGLLDIFRGKRVTGSEGERHHDR